jgi:3-deoxy-D-manno-octulosonic acid (KDO) 8-phosphate synthase
VRENGKEKGVEMINELGRQFKGDITTVHTAITATATSAIVDCRGYNAILIDFTISGTANWTISLTGSLNRNGTYKALYELANTGSMAAMSYQTNASRLFIFKGIPDWVKVVATEDADGQTVTVKVQPLNI